MENHCPYSIEFWKIGLKYPCVMLINVKCYALV